MHVDVRLMFYFGVCASVPVASITLTRGCPVTFPCRCIGIGLLDCSRERLRTVPQFVRFEENWQILDLSDNLINYLAPSQFAKVKISTLDLSRNMLRTLDKHSFRDAPQLHTLDLSYNAIEFLPDHIFSSLRTLRTLRLQYNKIPYVKPNVLIKLHKLYALDFSGNSFSKIPTKSLSHLRSLKRLSFRNNRITEIEEYGFIGLSLEYLDLGGNKAPVLPLHIHKWAFCGLDPRLIISEPTVKEWSGLTTLLLDHNGLGSIEPCLTSSIWTLKRVDLSGMVSSTLIISI